MAGMDFSGRRADRGISVFWMILAMGAGTFALVAILLVGTDRATEPVPYDDEAEVIVTEGETQVLGAGNSSAAADDNDPTMLDEDVTVAGPQEEGDLSVENVEVDVDAAGGSEEATAPAEGAADAGEGAEAAATEEAVESDAAPAEGTDEAVATGEADVPGEDEIVVDPDGTTGPVEPTPSGPEGRDGETIVDEVTD